MRARTFMQVSIGILALALAYHFGATSARAQSPGNPIVVATDLFVYTANGDYYYRMSPTTWVVFGNVFASAGAVPGQIVAATNTMAYTANGDVYEHSSTTGPWALTGNLLASSPAPARSTSFGALKAKYR